MEKLIRGAAQFNAEGDPSIKDEIVRLASAGQTPSTLLITCVDSRILPSVITNASPGEMLVLRNIGNIVPHAEDSSIGSDASVSSTVSFALEMLAVTDIIVLGHSGCGGVAELRARQNDFRSDALGTWLKNGRPALQRFSTQELANEGLTDINRLSQLNVLNSLSALAGYPEARQRLDRMHLTLHGWWFDLDKALLLAHEPRAGRFVPVEQAYGSALRQAHNPNAWA